MHLIQHAFIYVKAENHNSFHIKKIQYFKNFNILKKYLDINQKRFNLRYLFSSLLKDTHSSSTPKFK